MCDRFGALSIRVKRTFLPFFDAKPASLFQRFAKRKTPQTPKNTALAAFQKR
jgi:hypothetical protein